LPDDQPACGRQACLRQASHIHLVAAGPDVAALAAVLRPVHLRYAQQYNRQMGTQSVFA